jgi:hypothetical protein
MKQPGDIYVNFFSCTCHHAQRRCMKGFSSCRQGLSKYRLPHVSLYILVIQNFHIDNLG